jgi:hypothetical protein
MRAAYCKWPYPESALPALRSRLRTAHCRDGPEDLGSTVIGASTEYEGRDSCSPMMVPYLAHGEGHPSGGVAAPQLAQAHGFILADLPVSTTSGSAPVIGKTVRIASSKSWMAPGWVLGSAQSSRHGERHAQDRERQLRAWPWRIRSSHRVLFVAPVGGRMHVVRSQRHCSTHRK